MRCPHGTNSIHLGPVTLHLTDAELALIDRAIHKLAAREPALDQAMQQAIFAEMAAEAGKVP